MTPGVPKSLTRSADTDEIVAVRDCQWEDDGYVVPSADHPLRMRPELRLEETSAENWAADTNRPH